MTLHVYADLAALSQAAAEHVLAAVKDAVARRGRFTWVLAGGSTPNRLYALLADRYGDQIPWGKVYVFWGDERLVPVDHPDSNFHAARRALLSQVPIPPDNVYPVTGSEGPDAAAQAYEQALKVFFRPKPDDGQPPRFDLVLLGMGEDGHTASLFPSSPALGEQTRWVAGVCGPATRPPRARVTLTLPVLNRARQVVFLIAGQSKRDVLKKILNTPDAAQHYPAARVNPKALHWFVDQAAIGET